MNCFTLLIFYNCFFFCFLFNLLGDEIYLLLGTSFSSSFFSPIVRLVLPFLWSSGCWQVDLCSCAFYKSNLNIWEFSVHILLKPGLENFKHYFASVWGECSCVVVWIFLALSFFGIGMKTDLFHYWIFQISWHTECCTLTTRFERAHWNSIMSTSFIHSDAS